MSSMSQDRATQFPPQSGQHLGLHARLRTALDSLDLDFESELARFRQSKTGNFSSSAGYTSQQTESSANHVPKPEDHIVHEQIASEPVLETTAPATSLSHETLSIPPFDLAAILDGSRRSLQGSQTKALPPIQKIEGEDGLSSVNQSEAYMVSTELLRNSLIEVDLEVVRPERKKRTVQFPLAMSLGILSVGLAGLLAFLVYASRPVAKQSAQSKHPIEKSAPAVSKPPQPRGVPSAANLAQVEFQNLNQTSLSVLQSSSELSENRPARNPVRVVIVKADAAMLSRAQRFVPDAFLEASDQGTKIQLGIFSDLGRAEALVNSLQRNGLAAQIERP